MAEGEPSLYLSSPHLHSVAEQGEGTRSSQPCSFLRCLCSPAGGGRGISEGDPSRRASCSASCRRSSHPPHLALSSRTAPGPTPLRPPSHPPGRLTSEPVAFSSSMRQTPHHVRCCCRCVASVFVGETSQEVPLTWVRAAAVKQAIIVNYQLIQ